jgi:hypothetical protein
MSHGRIRLTVSKEACCRTAFHLSVSNTRMTPDVSSKLEIYNTERKGVYRCELISNAHTADFYSRRHA